MTCKCGCGREAGLKNGKKLRYYSPDCYPSAKKLAASKAREPEDKLCKCGCGRWFTDASPQRQGKFYSKQCRSNYWNEHNDTNKPVNSHLYSSAGRSFKDHRAKICNNDGRGPLCDDYCECLDPNESGKIVMKFQTNGGSKCYKKPDSKFRVNSPNSFGVCSDNSSYY